MGKAKVTFVLPTMRDIFLPASLHSIKKQIFTDWELLIYNTKPGRKLKETDRRIKVFDTPEMRAEECFNDAHHNTAQTDIIMHQCDDDLSAPERALISYLYMVDMRVDMLFGSFLAINKKGKILYYRMNHLFDGRMLKETNVQCSSAFSAYNRKKVPDFRTDFVVLTDYVFQLESFFKGLRMCGTFSVLGFKRFWESQVSKLRHDQLEEEKVRVREFFKDPTLMNRQQDPPCIAVTTK